MFLQHFHLQNDKKIKLKKYEISKNILNVADVNDDLMDTCEGNIEVVCIDVGLCSTIGKVSFDIDAIIGDDFSRLDGFDTDG